MSIQFRSLVMKFNSKPIEVSFGGEILDYHLGFSALKMQSSYHPKDNDLLETSLDISGALSESKKSLFISAKASLDSDNETHTIDNGDSSITISIMAICDEKVNMVTTQNVRIGDTIFNDQEWVTVMSFVAMTKFRLRYSDNRGHHINRIYTYLGSVENPKKVTGEALMHDGPTITNQHRNFPADVDKSCGSLIRGDYALVNASARIYGTDGSKVVNESVRDLNLQPQQYAIFISGFDLHRNIKNTDSQLSEYVVALDVALDGTVSSTCYLRDDGGKQIYGDQGKVWGHIIAMPQ